MNDLRVDDEAANATLPTIALARERRWLGRCLTATGRRDHETRFANFVANGDTGKTRVGTGDAARVGAGRGMTGLVGKERGEATRGVDAGASRRGTDLAATEEWGAEAGEDVVEEEGRAEKEGFGLRRIG